MTGYKRDQLLSGMVVVGTFLIGLFGLSGVGRAAIEPGGVIVVNSSFDVVADDGVCTLREAVTASNNDEPSGYLEGECTAGTVTDVISLPFGTYSLTLTGAGDNQNSTGDLDVWGAVTIEAEDYVVIDGMSTDRLFHVIPGGTLTLKGLTITNGNAPFGGGLESSGGGILSEGSLSVYNSEILSNRAGDGDFEQVGGDGGGIAHLSPGSITLEQVVIRGNTAGRGGDGTPGTVSRAGANGGNGGGIYIINSMFPIRFHTIEVKGNQAGAGGHKFYYPNNLVPNGYGGRGGGIYLEGIAMVELHNCDINQNNTQGPYGGNGGGIASIQVELKLYDCTIRNNRASDGQLVPGEVAPVSDGGTGGGIWHLGNLVVARTRISGNRAGDGIGTAYIIGPQGPTYIIGAGGGGGGIALSQGSLHLSQSVLAQNSAGDGEVSSKGVGAGGNGGGLRVEYAPYNGTTPMTITIENSSILENRAGASGFSRHGGGVSLSGHLNIHVFESLVANNAAFEGGGIYIATSLPNGFVESIIKGSTFVRNTTEQKGNWSLEQGIPLEDQDISLPIFAGGSGGGIFVANDGGIIVQHSTIVSNTSDLHGGGIYVVGNNTMTMGNSILSGNNAIGSGPNCAGDVNGTGYILIEDDAGCIMGGNTIGNIVGQSPLVNPLADNGGLTKTMALSAESPARDAGSCQGENTMNIDQRGYGRPVDLRGMSNADDGCDIGAFEVQGVTIEPNLLTVAEGGDGATYQVALVEPPTASVTITLAITDEIIVSPTTLFFETTTWTLPQTITVSAVDDDMIEGIETVTVEHTISSADPFYNNLPVGAARVMVMDNDVASLPTTTATITPLITRTPRPSLTPTSTPQGGIWDLFLPMIER